MCIFVQRGEVVSTYAYTHTHTSLYLYLQMPKQALEDEMLQNTPLCAGGGQGGGDEGQALAGSGGDTDTGLAMPSGQGAELGTAQGQAWPGAVSQTKPPPDTFSVWRNVGAKPHKKACNS